MESKRLRIAKNKHSMTHHCVPKIETLSPKAKFRIENTREESENDAEEM